MSNDLATLTTKLSTALKDTTNAVWSSAELNDILTWSLAELFPHISRPLDPTSETVTLVADTYFYSLPAGLLTLSRVDWVDTDSNELGPLASGSWEVVGDPLMGTGKLHVAPTIVDQGGTLRLNGYGRFDLSNNLIPDDFVRLLLAIARAEAYRRLAADREQFKVWLQRNQTANVTINELVLLINEADAEAERIRRRVRVWQKPVPARV